VVRNLTCVHPGELIEPALLPLLAGAKQNGHTNGNGTFQKVKSTIVAEFERTYLQETLDAADGNISRAARTAGKPRRAFFELMRKHGINARR